MYRFFFRTVLTRIDPERAHHLGMLVLRIAGVPPFRWIVRALTRPAASLRTRALGVTFDSPFGIAAGFDKNGVALSGLWAFGFGHDEVGTVTAIAQAGNPKPRLFRLPLDDALINRMGFNNDGAEAVTGRLRAHRGPRPVVGVNIGKSRVTAVEEATADYVASATLASPVADYLVVNVSSPNTPGLRGLQAAETLRPLLEAVHAAAGSTPLLVKIAPDLEDADVTAIARLAVELGIAGIILTNTTISREGLRTPAAQVESIGAGGLSGKPLAARSLAVLRLVRGVVPEDFCVVSVGGVDTAADVVERLDAGATLVQGYSAFIYRGPFWGRQINRALAKARRASV